MSDLMSIEPLLFRHNIRDFNHLYERRRFQECLGALMRARGVTEDALIERSTGPGVLARIHKDLYAMFDTNPTDVTEQQQQPQAPPASPQELYDTFIAQAKEFLTDAVALLRAAVFRPDHPVRRLRPLRLCGIHASMWLTTVEKAVPFSRLLAASMKHVTPAGVAEQRQRLRAALATLRDGLPAALKAVDDAASAVINAPRRAAEYKVALARAELARRTGAATQPTVPPPPPPVDPKAMQAAAEQLLEAAVAPVMALLQLDVQPLGEFLVPQLYGRPLTLRSTAFAPLRREWGWQHTTLPKPIVNAEAYQQWLKTVYLERADERRARGTISLFEWLRQRRQHPLEDMRAAAIVEYVRVKYERKYDTPLPVSADLVSPGTVGEPHWSYSARKQYRGIDGVPRRLPSVILALEDTVWFKRAREALPGKRRFAPLALVQVPRKQARTEQI